MARRVSWTNNSSGHDGAYVYRDTTIDPQNLPEPIATVDPVAQGATAEWVDTEELDAGDYDYAVRDFEGSSFSDLSTVFTYSITSPAGFDTAFNTNLSYSNEDRTATYDLGSSWQTGYCEASTEKDSGSWYWEIVVHVIGTGVSPGGSAIESQDFVGSDSGGGFAYHANGRIYVGGSFVSHESYVDDDVLGFAVNLDSNEVSVYKNNTLIATEAFSRAGPITPAASLYSSELTVCLNSPNLTYQPPQGFAAVGD